MRFFYSSFLVSSFFVAGSALAEPYITAEKIMASLGEGKRLEYLVPCALGKDETLCALIHMGAAESDEFRIYTYDSDPAHSAKVLYTFKPAAVGGAQSLLGMVSPSPPNQSLTTYWSLPGMHSEGNRVEIRVSLDKNGKYFAKVIRSKN